MNTLILKNKDFVTISLKDLNLETKNCFMNNNNNNKNLMRQEKKTTQMTCT